MKRAIIAATLTLLAIPALAYAQPGDRYVDRRSDVETRSVEVYVGDLDVRDVRAEREARRRIRSAAEYVCAPRADLRELGDNRDYRGCRDDAYFDAVDELHERAGLPRGRVIIRERPYGE